MKVTKQTDSESSAKIYAWKDALRTKLGGVSEVTGWRWRQAGIINPFEIHGRLFITEEEIQRFIATAQAGQCALTPAARDRAAKHHVA